MKSKPLILVTNDDGITAPGIAVLVHIAKTFGEVVVVAPDSPQSGQGHAITLESPLRLHPTELFTGVDAYECSGTPVDCVKLAKNVLLKDRQIDLCLSGVNHGSNASINIIYSGTMSAAMEAALEGINSIGFSLMEYGHGADFSHAVPYISDIISKVVEHGLYNPKLLNVNIPPRSQGHIKGVKICRQAKGYWEETFQEGEDPRGQKYYWLTGRFILDDAAPDSDIAATEAGYISVVPSHHDLTDYNALSHLEYLTSAR